MTSKLSEQTVAILTSIVETSTVDGKDTMSTDMFVRAVDEVKGSLTKPETCGYGIRVGYDLREMSLGFAEKAQATGLFVRREIMVRDPELITVPNTEHARAIIQTMLDNNSGVS